MYPGSVNHYHKPPYDDKGRILPYALLAPRFPAMSYFSTSALSECLSGIRVSYVVRTFRLLLDAHYVPFLLRGI